MSGTIEEKECCRNCNKRLDLVKLDYSKGGCEHTPMEGFACLAFAYEGQVSWMIGVDEEGQCEMYSPKEDKDNERRKS